MAEFERIHTAFLNFGRRAERVDDNLLESSFVDTPPLLQRVSVRESQIVYGRRGTGKTHVLKYVATTPAAPDIYKVYIDLRLIGSNQSLYGDPTLPLIERATRLIIDVVGAFAGELNSIAAERMVAGGPSEEIVKRLSDLSEALVDVQVVGEASTQSKVSRGSESNLSARMSAAASSDASVSGGIEASEKITTGSEDTSSLKGERRYHLSFGRAQTAVASLIDILGLREVNFFIDEWSEFPLDLQPLLADSIRKIFLTNRKISVKIAAIEHRTSLITPLDGNQYIGFEVGADIPTGLNLDDFLVFDNDQERAVEFFKKLLFNHLKIVDPDTDINNPEELQREVFTERRAVEEFVRAVEGVPRDALNLISILAEKRFGKTFGVPDVRAAAREWYTRDKFAVIDKNPALSEFLLNIIRNVIRGRKARAFLVQSATRDKRIETLFDLRILHVLKRNVSSNENPGIRYDVYKFDYGCYVDLISTASAPSGMFSEDDAGSVEVPADDYRSIRRAILNLEEI